MLVTRVSVISRKENTMDLDITRDQLNRYEFGLGLIQDIFPNLPHGEREFIKTGITPQEWEELFGVEV
jgi:hypothetical protein